MYACASVCIYILCREKSKQMPYKSEAYKKKKSKSTKVKAVLGKRN